MNEVTTELEAARKLLETLHLSVPERTVLPRGRLRFSIMLAAVRAALEETGWFPPHRRPAQYFVGAIIEAKPDGTIHVHERFETGVMRVSDPVVRVSSSLDEAVRAYVRQLGDDAIDGVQIDWAG